MAIAGVSHAAEAADQYKSDYSKGKPKFGGPTSPEGQLEDADLIKEPAFRFPDIDAFFEPWTKTKERWHTENDLAFSGHYSVMLTQIEENSRSTDQTASSGVFRANLRWTPLKSGKDTGALFLTVDHRHAFTDTAPADLAASAGYLGVANTFYSDIGGAIINLNWQQSLNDRQSGIVVGRFDPNDYQSVHVGTNPWTLFSNVATVIEPSIAIPDSSWGLGAGHWFNDNVYVLGGVNDANGLGSDNLEWFAGGAELYSWGHTGWSPSQQERYYKNIHVSIWHADARDARIDDGFTGADSAKGINFSANWLFAELWMPFARYGYSSGSAPLYNESVTLGILKKLHYRSDVLGLATNWGDPPDNNLPEQLTAEVFWQFQFSQNLEITPSLQYLKNPAFNTSDSSLWQASLRFHLIF
ncbi:MAG: carbohydrate porin [Pseudomonadales bacterium]|nr:carbohydrate porin [Pseudomonadales bacterium]